MAASGEDDAHIAESIVRDETGREIEGQRLPESEEERVEREDWEAAKFAPLHDSHPEFAREISELLVDAFLREAGDIRDGFREQAIAGLHLQLGVTPSGRRMICVDLPMGEGHNQSEWDGTIAHAREIAVGLGETAGQNFAVDQ